MAETATRQFKAEINQLLDILVHSLYTNKEIFLRELVSNASDALEKYRFVQTTDGDDDTPLEIAIATDAENGTLTITDTGVGMTAEELEENLGTIAHSGSAEFARAAAEGKESVDSLIGRFGVGFYSVYMVADTVDVETKSYRDDAEGVRWSSDGRGTYEIAPLDAERPRGTAITVHLKKDVADEFTDADSLRSIIKRHSNFIGFPILVDAERVNTVPALWREPKFQISAEQYEEFYKFLTYDSEGPMDTMHISVDAPVQFNALLFIPPTDQDVFAMMDRENWGQDLYVRRVLIQRQNKDLLPQYLSFIKGVVDTEDLPLNISREMLQDNLLIRKIQTTLTKQVLSHLGKLAKEDPEKYERFWREHGKVFRTGYSDFANKERIAPLLRFNSSACEDAEGLVSLDDYVARAKDGQKAIYYAYGQSREAMNLNPHLELFRDKGVEVLYMYEPIDEFVVDAMRDYKEMPFTAAEHADPADLAAFESTEKKKSKPRKLTDKQQQTLTDMLKRFKDILGPQVTEVKASDRLSESPVCLANPDGNVTSSMEKIMRVVSKDTSIPAKVLEVNPDHPMIRNLLKVYKKDPEDDFLEAAAKQLYESALLLEGYLNDPHALVGRIQDLLTRSSQWYTER